ncbi:22867_t:CDS:2, partial [Racocetra persica]
GDCGELEAHRGHRCACERPSPLCLTRKLDLALRGSCVTVGNIKQFEKIVEAYPQNTVGIIVTSSQKRCSFNSSKRAKSSKSSASILFTSVNEMATDIPAYFLLRKDY